jgi:hypothetical protein
MRPFVITAMILAVISTALVSRIWNSKPYGPDVANFQIYLGCYGVGGDRIVIQNGRVSVARDGQSTTIIRFHMLKSDAVINTVNDLRLNASGADLRVGTASSGFFYKFDNALRPSALLVPDDRGIEHALPRTVC